jgi:cell division initiation protein
VLSPVEIRNQEFRRGMFGYKVSEVDAFLNHVFEDFEKLYRDNAELRETIQRTEYEMAKYKKIEENLNQTLVLAQKTAEEVKANAQKEAELLMQTAHTKIAEILSSYEEILKRLSVYRTEMKSFIATQGELLERHERRIEEFTASIYGQDVKEMLLAANRVSGESGR